MSPVPARLCEGQRLTQASKPLSSSRFPRRLSLEAHLENDRPSDLALWRQLEFRKACGAHAKGETGT
jgi:hypothetical protein